MKRMFDIFRDVCIHKNPPLLSGEYYQCQNQPFPDNDDRMWPPSRETNCCTFCSANPQSHFDMGHSFFLQFFSNHVQCSCYRSTGTKFQFINSQKQLLNISSWLYLFHGNDCYCRPTWSTETLLELLTHFFWLLSSSFSLPGNH